MLFSKIPKDRSLNADSHFREVSMKINGLLTIGLSLSLSAYAVEDHKTEHEHVFTPEQEYEFRTRVQKSGGISTMATGFRFAQSSWSECNEDPSGNFSGYRCAASRQISVILKKFLQENIYTCVDEALATQGRMQAADIHIIHDGILGDRNHSPRSLHAEARAIDIKALEVTYKTGSKKTFTFAGSANRTFYKAFRKCWGRIIRTKNGCPYYNGIPERTATIGQEDSNHQYHMHTSVPYCVNGSYGSGFFQK